MRATQYMIAWVPYLWLCAGMFHEKHAEEHAHEDVGMAPKTEVRNHIGRLFSVHS
jgi:hypothetical protein